jgi:hypothetical protein
MAEAPPPGWYTSPSNPQAEQWWDGSAWGEHTRAATIAVPAPAVEANATVKTRSNPFAVVSLLCGLIGLIAINPVGLVSVTAIIMGALGIHRANDLKAVTGNGVNKPAAIVGLILGIIGLMVFIANFNRTIDTLSSL